MKIRASQILPIVAVVALLVVGWVAIRTQNAAHTDGPADQLVDPEKLAAANPLPDAISIPALREHGYDGTDFTVGDVLDSGNGYTQYAISYSGNGLYLTGTMTKPAGSGPFPIVILDHGLVDTDTYTTGSILNYEQQYLAQHGYVAVVPDYRSHGGSDYDPNVDLNLRYGYAIDVINLIYALQRSALDYVDPTRVGMIGYSMGGAIALGVAVSQPTLVDALVLYSPISADLWTDVHEWMQDSPQYDEIISRYGTPETNERFWKQASPATYLADIKAPILIHHGTADTYVPITYSEELVKEFQAVNSVPVVFDKYLDQGHDLGAALDESLTRTVEFLDQYVH